MSQEQKELMDEISSHPRAVMMGSPDQAQFLAWLCRLISAKKVLEVGVFRGFTTLTLAQALPEDGQVVGLDISEEYAETGKKYWQRAGVTSKIDFRVGLAVESMDTLLKEGHAGTFDLCFIDADKSNYDSYYEGALKLVRKGGVIAVDNVLWSGRILSPAAEQDDDAKAVAALNEKLVTDDRISMNMLGIADGLSLCEVK